MTVIADRLIDSGGSPAERVSFSIPMIRQTARSMVRKIPQETT